MINNTLSSYNVSTASIDTNLNSINTGQKNIKELESTLSLSPSLPISISSRQTWLVFAAAVFLVSVPVFIEAPLVRSLPIISLAMTGFWVWLSFNLMSRPATYLWGDLLLGFSWSWLAGAIYWGWLRWEPVWHLPLESIGLPFACWCLLRNWGKVGSWFYLGSLLGTVLTDVYFYIVDLMPYWRQIMQVEPAGAPLILQNALIQVQTPLGQAWAIILASVLLTAGILPLRQRQRHWYAFGGAVLSTILVDSLFLLAACAA
ncbi:DUF3120 domain-containing protein [Nostocaceae cyanobacterium CENA357]|uniref:DUF3120 domain-containing protein n=1 Tax=Atlanticothrix silvestris CENA357 TaxID=1725252 RepID=A0A8J7HCI7_9CYAN|nr:DUF3120 domain-containing protein [Atlanticothrix silvestris]MBH8553002.1 DUF3120 domain-containing protein [Atlanticothrix silvestris CENA357]